MAGFLDARVYYLTCPYPFNSYSRHSLTSRGRIHDGKDGGVAFFEGGKGQVEGCQIWGNAEIGVGIRDNGSEAVVARCKCASEGAPLFSPRLHPISPLAEHVQGGLCRPRAPDETSAALVSVPTEHASPGFLPRLPPPAESARTASA